jgi:hypothetical protein
MPQPNFDIGSILPEGNLSLPWAIDNPEATYLEYQAWVECLLDPGTALHKILPQAAATIDTLANVFIDDPDLATFTDGGVNLRSNSGAVDIIQQMATSSYTFLLRGHGVRVGYQIPIPGLRSVGGALAVPTYPQSAYNQVVGNFSGIPIFFAAWDLAYLVTVSPELSNSQIGSPEQGAIAPNVLAAIRGDAQLPDSISLPWTVTDYNATTSTLRNI